MCVRERGDREYVCEGVRERDCVCGGCECVCVLERVREIRCVLEREREKV